jgi:prevent-host-death family protein
MKPLQLQDAKQQFCAIAQKAAAGKPQLVTKRGRPHVWIVGANEWKKSHPKRRSLVEGLRSCPVDLTEIDLSRSKELPRKVVL